ncbi:hypothetical protein HMPREF1631_01555 [Arcanobacterium sp. S3PF19]|nr:hypothetical protein HMPREF1631_01555 [Arcanobacterium sp. S3PF19]
MATNEAMLRGMKKAIQIYANPDPRKNRQYRSSPIRHQDPLTAAWNQVGQSMQTALNQAEKKINL